MPLSAGSRLEIPPPLGAGGMGEVYRTVAVQILPAGSADQPEARERFERSAVAMAQRRQGTLPCSRAQAPAISSPAAFDAGMPCELFPFPTAGDFWSTWRPPCLPRNHPSSTRLERGAKMRTI